MAPDDKPVMFEQQCFGSSAGRVERLALYKERKVDNPDNCRESNNDLILVPNSDAGRRVP